MYIFLHASVHHVRSVAVCSPTSPYHAAGRKEQLCFTLLRSPAYIAFDDRRAQSSHRTIYVLACSADLLPLPGRARTCAQTPAASPIHTLLRFLSFLRPFCRLTTWLTRANDRPIGPPLDGRLRVSHTPPSVPVHSDAIENPRRPKTYIL